MFLIITMIIFYTLYAVIIIVKSIGNIKKYKKAISYLKNLNENLIH